MDVIVPEFRGRGHDETFIQGKSPLLGKSQTVALVSVVVMVLVNGLGL